MALAEFADHGTFAATMVNSFDAAQFLRTFVDGNFGRNACPTWPLQDCPLRCLERYSVGSLTKNRPSGISVVLAERSLNAQLG